MSKPSEAQTKWLKALAAMGGGGGGGLAALLEEPGDSTPEPDVPAGPIAAALGDQSTPVAAPAKGSPRLPGGGKPAASTFVPELETSGAFKRELAVGEKITLHLKVRNWAKLPKGTVLDWGASSSGKAVDIELEHHGGEGTVTVTGLAAGEGVVKAEVKVSGGGTYTFSDTVFAVHPAATAANTDPDSSADEGGIASVTDLEQDMRNILQDWKGAAADGVHQFTTNTLSSRIDKLESGSATTFLVGLLGNTIWAAAAFSTGGAAFAISMTGIGVAATPTVPTESKSFIPVIEQAMFDHIYEIYRQLDKSLRKKAQALASSQPGITRFRALAAFVAASFKPGLYTVNAKNTSIPTLNMLAIRDLFERKASQELDAAIKADELRRREKEREYYKYVPKRSKGHYV